MECFEALLTRRSIRRFKGEDVPLDKVLKAIDVARYAPSAKNSQPWRFIVVKNPETIKRLSELSIGARPLASASIAVVVLANKDESPTSYLVDGALAAMYFWLALHCMGLGAVWIQTLRRIEEINKLLGVPSNYVPVAIFAIGYPAEKPPVKPRRPLEEIVFIDKYGNKIQSTGK